MEPISCTECNAINWSPGLCRSCEAPLVIVDQRGEASAQVGAGASNDATTESPVRLPIPMDPRRTQIKEQEAMRSKALEDPEMRKKMLKEKIKYLKGRRTALTANTRAFDKRGRVIPGGRVDFEPRFEQATSAASGPAVDAAVAPMPELV